MTDMRSALALLMVSVSVCAGEWEGVTSDTAPAWYQAYLLLLSVGLPLYVFISWLRRRLRERSPWSIKISLVQRAKFIVEFVPGNGVSC